MKNEQHAEQSALKKVEAAHAGQVYVGRTQRSKPVPMHGSKIEHDTTITLQISTGSHSRSCGTDRYFPEKLMAEVEMTQTQFAEMITSFNQGNGTPCTLRFIDGKRIESNPKRPDPLSTLEAESGNADTRAIDSLRSLLITLGVTAEKKRPLSVSSQREIISKLLTILSNLESDREFYKEQACRDIESMVQEAKATVEAHLALRFQQIAIATSESQQLIPSQEIGDTQT